MLCTSGFVNDVMFAHSGDVKRTKTQSDCFVVNSDR